MPSYQTITRQDEKSSLLGSEFIRQHPELGERPIVVEHYYGAPRGACDPESGYRKRRSGCCARLCKAFFWTVFATFALIFFLGLTNHRSRFPTVSYTLYTLGPGG